MNQSLILDLLENNARLTSQDLADILNEDEASIKSEIQSLEKLNGLNHIKLVWFNTPLCCKISHLIIKSSS